MDGKRFLSVLPTFKNNRIVLPNDLRFYIPYLLDNHPVRCQNSGIREPGICIPKPNTEV